MYVARVLIGDSTRRRRVYRNHPDVKFKPGPFYMGDGIFGWMVNIICVLWTLFITVLFCMPEYLPVNKNNMNYASVSFDYLLALCSVGLITSH